MFLSRTVFLLTSYSQMQSDWLGSLSVTEGSIISWSLDPRAITTPYQSSRNDDHNTCLVTSTSSHNKFNSLYRQHNCCSLSLMTRWNSLSKSLSRSGEHTHLVSPKQDMSCSQTRSREIQNTCRSSVQNKQINLNRMVSQSVNCKCNFSHDQISQIRSNRSKYE